MLPACRSQGRMDPEVIVAAHGEHVNAAVKQAEEVVGTRRVRLVQPVAEVQVIAVALNDGSCQIVRGRR